MTQGTHGFRLEIYEELGSTSDLCAQRAAAGEEAGLAVLALRQTSGRGSRGRDWSSPIGNLSLSILLRGPASAANVGSMALLAGVAVSDALAPALLDPSDLTLKWPNDLMLRGAKFGGILIEATHGGSAGPFVVLGIGLNLAVAPTIPGRATAALTGGGGPKIRPEEAAREILAALGAWLKRIDDRPAIHAAWLRRAHPIGTWLTVGLNGQILEGRFAGLSDQGFLKLDTRGGLRVLTIGEVMLPADPARPASDRCDRA